VKLWPAWVERPDAQPRWAWKGIAIAVALFLLAAVLTVLTGVVVLVSLAFR
jgi:hypothetical protein